MKKLNQLLPVMSQSCDDGHLKAGSGGWWAPWALVVWKAVRVCGRSLQKEGTFGLRPEEEVVVRQVRAGIVHVKAWWGVQGR